MSVRTALTPIAPQQPFKAAPYVTHCICTAEESLRLSNLVSTLANATPMSALFLKINKSKINTNLNIAPHPN